MPHLHGDPVDVQRDFGASGSPLATTGTIAAGSNVLSLTSPLDFRDGQGIWLPHAGPSCALPIPPAPTVTIGGGPSGTSSYGYVIVALDGAGGVSATSPTGLITTGPATLGGLNDDGGGEGQLIYQARLLAISVTPVPGADGGYAVYRTQVPGGSGLSLGFLGIYRVTNTPFLDYGQAVKEPPPGVPAVPPAEPLGQSLVTTIVAGGGSPTLILAASATTAYTGTVYHDDTFALQAAYAAGSAAVYHPPGSYGVSAPLTYAVLDGCLYGIAGSSTIRYQGNAGATLIVNASGVTVRDLAFDGGQLTTDTLVTLGAGEASPLDDLTVAATAGVGGVNGLNGYNASGTWYHRVSMIGNRYRNCLYAYGLTGFWAEPIIAGNHADFSDLNYTGRGINLHNSAAGGHPRHWTVTGNVIRAGQHTGGIVVQGAGYGSLTGNVVLVAGGVYGLAAIGDGTYDGQSNGIIFADNYCEALWRETGVAVMLDNMVQVTVAGNVINGFGYAFQVEYPSAAGHIDAVSDHLTFSDNQLVNIGLGVVVGPSPLAAQFIDNAGQNPLGELSPPASPPVSGAAYQNRYGVWITVYQAAYAASPGVNGTVAVALGPADPPSLLYTRQIAGSTEATTPDVVTVRVPPGWWYGFTVTDAVLGGTHVIGE
jgi:hypothetical protein